MPTTKTTRIKLAPDLSRSVNRFGKQAINIRITKYKYVTSSNIGEYIPEDIWDTTNRRVYYHYPKDHPKEGLPVESAHKINERIEKKLSMAENFIREYFLRHGHEPEPKQVGDYIQGKHSPKFNKGFDFLAWAEYYIDEHFPARKTPSENKEYHEAVKKLRKLLAHVQRKKSRKRNPRGNTLSLFSHAL